MVSIGIRELRQHASKYVDLAKKGETITITERGRPVAVLKSVPQAEGLAKLQAEGRVTMPTRSWREIGPPLPPTPGVPLPSKILEELREYER